jgi:hypothetical protein
MYYKHRHYSIGAGRFLQSDPIGLKGGLNLYAYCFNASLSNVDPYGLWVEGSYNRTTGMLTLGESGRPGTNVTAKAWSGNGKYGVGYPTGYGANGQYDNVYKQGPLPKGEYLIGNKYQYDKYVKDHPGGEHDWYRLYHKGKDGKWRWNELKDKNGNVIERGDFLLHTGLDSDGCITIPSEVPQTDSGYPRSRDFAKIKKLLDNTAQKPIDPNRPDDQYIGRFVVY